MSGARRLPQAESRSVKAGAEFRRVLADVGEASVGASEETALLINPAAGAAFPTPGTEPPSGVDWRDITGWFVEGEDQPPPRPEAPFTDRLEDIAEELGVDRALDEAALNRTRRRFMWRNHPDRRAESQREIATRRVAIANMLIDRAFVALAAKRKSQA